ncbi:hypothetical protein PLICRDRAFT_173026 [Plicaturopsis crispa FD-325 SS-3]|nr:hypothetical protein PLICRDRAFT_173026 [Plicaturopsis crispa FD-325 SS-3]
MSVIFGRTIKNEYLALGTLLGTTAIALAATGGSKKDAKPAPGKSTLQTIKDAVPINASSSEEEQFIKNFIAEAEGESKH